MKAIWINNILYEHQDKVLTHYNLEPADEYVKKVEHVYDSLNDIISYLKHL